MASAKVYAIGLFFFIGVCIIFAMLMQLNINWDTWRIATCMPDECFCEQIHHDETIRQPANTWSSMMFALVGILIAVHAVISLNDQQKLSRMFALILSFALIFIGIGSAFYHASMTFWGQFADVGSMYLLATFMLVYAWLRLFNLEINLSVILYLLMNSVLFALLYFFPETRRGAFAIVLLLGIGFELYYATSHKLSLKRYWFNYGLLLFAIAYAIWTVDNNRLLCVADSLLQGHAIWHIFGAVSSGMLYLYYASEIQESLPHADE